MNRKAAKRSAFSSNDLDKHKYLAGEDLDYRPDFVEQTRFEYSPFGKFFNRGLKEEDKKYGLLKRLKNIEGKNKEQLKVIKDKTGLKSKIDLSDGDLTSEVVAFIKEIKSIEENVDCDKLSFTGGNKKVCGLDSFKTFEKLIKDIHNKNMTIDETEIKQNKFAEKIDEFRAYSARGSKYIDLKESVSKNVEIFHNAWEKIVYRFKNKILPLSKKDDSGDQGPSIFGTPTQKRFDNFLKQIEEEQKNIDTELVNKYFSYQKPDEMSQDLFESKNKVDNLDKVVLIHKNFD